MGPVGDPPDAAPAEGAVGATSNPVIVNQAVRDSYDEWIPVLRKLIEENPKNWDLTILLGNFYFMLKKNNLAQEAYTRALEVEPENISSQKLKSTNSMKNPRLLPLA